MLFLLFALLQMLFGEAKAFLLQKDHTSGGRTSSARALGLLEQGDNELFCQRNHQGGAGSSLSESLKLYVVCHLTRR
jgi:hypothetical protein